MLGIKFLSIVGEIAKATDLPSTFPSPYWGLIFYLATGGLTTRNGSGPRSFRPHIRDYFFIKRSTQLNQQAIDRMFPSPYWGLIFYPYPL